MIKSKKHLAFTLIELLIVVAIIAILAAIAVPNFLEAQVRSKVSRGKADMRSLATAVESYSIDYNKYPADAQGTYGFGPYPDGYAPLWVLTTPTAFITSLPRNAFIQRGGWYDGSPEHYGYKSKTGFPPLGFPGGWAGGLDGWGMFPGWRPTWLGMGLTIEENMSWVLVSCGPDLLPSAGEYAMFGMDVVLNANPTAGEWGTAGAVYDPTNGTVSVGDIVRVGP